MKRMRHLIAAAALLIASEGLHAQGVMTFDLQSFLQTLATKSIGQSQLAQLGQIAGLNSQQVIAAQKIYSVLGDSSNSSLGYFNLGNLQTVLRGVPGLENLNIASLFPPGVGGAFLGLDYNNWKTSISDPSSYFAQQIQRSVVGDVVSQMGLPPDESSFLQQLAAPNSYLLRNQTALALSVGRLLTSHLISSLQTQGQQTAVYAAQKEQFNTQAQNNLTLVDRAKLNNNQNTLSLDMQMQQMQAQNLSNSAQAEQMDAQNKIMEDQNNRQEADRAASSDDGW
jgi:hypothetical protein